jgi:hypothetical protein
MRKDINATMTIVESGYRCAAYGNPAGSDANLGSLSLSAPGMVFLFLDGGRDDADEEDVDG